MVVDEKRMGLGDESTWAVASSQASVLMEICPLVT